MSNLTKMGAGKSEMGTFDWILLIIGLMIITAVVGMIGYYAKKELNKSVKESNEHLKNIDRELQFEDTLREDDHKMENSDGQLGGVDAKNAVLDKDQEI